jgi:two-component system nitrogen regulation response regulator GlnG
MTKKEPPNYVEHGFSAVIEKHLEKYLASHDEGVVPPGLYGRILNEVNRVVFRVTLRHFNGNQLKASKILGINRNTLRNKMIALKMLKIGEDNS